MAVPRIGVINATPLSMVPFTVAMQVEFPQADIRHVLDDSLLRDLRAAGRLTVELEGRMERLIEYVLAGEVAALQFACSGYSPVVDWPSPTRPDTAKSRMPTMSTWGSWRRCRPLELAEQQHGDLLSAQGSSARITTR
jgi:hypothetical protein